MNEEPKMQMPPDLAKIRRRYPRSYKAWSVDEDGQLKHELDSGQTIAAISKLHERQQSAVKSRMKHLENR